MEHRVSVDCVQVRHPCLYISWPLAADVQAVAVVYVQVGVEVSAAVEHQEGLYVVL